MTDGGQRRKRGRDHSASGDIDEAERPAVPAFEEVKEDEDLPEFEPVDDGSPAVVWEDDADHEVMERRWEELLDELFSDELTTFERIEDEIKWAPGEVIWEGMDFEEIFGDRDEFHAFEMMTALEKRRFLRNKLREHQASGMAEAGDLELEQARERRHPAHRAKRAPARPRGPGTMVSYDTETERGAEDLDTGLGPVRRKRTKG